MSVPRILVRLPLPLLCLLVAGCFLPPAQRFPADVATALREQPMRRLETDSLLIYYPEKRREDALRIAQRVEGCADVVRNQARIHNSYADQKMTIVIPDLPYNNAFVAPSTFGSESTALIPTSNTLDFTSELGIPPDPSYVGCHEIVHYIHLLQASGLWGWLNRYLGDTFTPQLGMDFWFIEGLATYYESRLQPGTGRMAWPAWRGAFHAAFAEKRINGGDLSAFQRPFHWGNHYLVGSHFVEFIAKRYGEETLWRVIDIQGDSILFPFGVALRWKAATGKSLPALIDEFASAVESQFPARPTPADQLTIRSAGSAARYAVAATGREALLVAGPDFSPALRVYDAGKQIVDRKLIEILPPRKLVVAHPILSSGLSFTADGKTLYFVTIDQGAIGQESRLMRYTIASDSLEVVVANLNGSGGSVSYDGKSYYYAYTDGDRRHLAKLDLASGTSSILRSAEPRNYFDLPRPSPNDQRLACALFNGKRFVIAILDARSGRTVAEVPFAGAVHDPSWIDDRRVLFLAEYQGRFQVHIYDVESARLQRVSDAPYLAFQPRVHGNAIRFLNRKGWRWTIDEVPLPAAGNPETQQVAALPQEAPSTQASTANREIQIHSDQPYSQLDSLFYPHFRAPLLVSSEEGANLIGLQLAGGDPLGFHRWAIFGQYDLIGHYVSGGAHYINSMLAPLELRAELEYHKWNESILVDNETQAGPLHAETRGLFAVGRTIRSSRIDLVGIALKSQEADNPDPDLRERQLAGPGLQLQHQALRSTPYAGARQGYTASGSATHYNEALSSLDVDLTDLGASLNLITPLPFFARHTLALGLRGRRLYGLDRDKSFLVIGGSTAAAELWRKSDQEDPDELVLPSPEPLVTFQEPLRGFEDLEFSSDRIAIADLSYRLPLILDFGFASTAYLLPSLFFHQINLELFAAGASDSFAKFDAHKHLAAGAAAALDLSLWVIPMRLRYQLARRFTDDDALVHLLTLGAAL